MDLMLAELGREKESEEPQFDIRDRDYSAKAWYLKDTAESKGDALIEISLNGEVIRRFLFPAYKMGRPHLVDGHARRPVEKP